MEETPILNEHNKQEYPPAHTAEHILNQAMVRTFGCSRSRVNHIERKKSKCNYALPTCPTAEQIRAIEAEVNRIISADLPVTTRYVTRDEVPESIDLSKLPEDASETLRLVLVGDYDVCPCLGAHVEHTSQIGHFRISSTNYTDGNLRIVFRVETTG
jgi:Ser-tRNA(Ala) deacylase AlaX